MMPRTFVIAEMGSTWQFGPDPLHNALQGIRLAKQAGSQAVKLQWCSAPRKMEKRRRVKKGTYDGLNWPRDWMLAMKAICEQEQVEFMCTVFLPEDIAVIAPYVTRFKVASLESLDAKFVRAHAVDYRPIYVSSGAMSGEMDGVDAEIGWPYVDLPAVRWLQCTAAYPCPPDAANILAIAENGFEGFSDHTGDLMAGALAVACGATIIEVHFRLSRTPKDNPDYAHSHGPERLTQYIANIRKAELMLGDGLKKMEACEQAVAKHRVIL